MERVALLGLGAMGSGIALSLLRAGHATIVWNRTPEARDALRAAGASVASNPADCVENARTVLSALADGPATLQTLELASPGMRPGRLWIQAAAVGIDETRRIAERIEAERCAFLDAPVLRPRGPARAGALTVLASGETDTVRRAAPVLAAVGSRVGLVGSAGRLKLVLNTWLCFLYQGIAEALALASALGVGQDQRLEVLDGGPLDSPAARAKAQRSASGDFEPADFGLSLAAMDLRHAAGAAGIDLKAATAIRQQIEAAIADGHRDSDVSVSATYLTVNTTSTSREDI
jgi:3-hydroxyisobutyrate dehydrogenase